MGPWSHKQTVKENLVSMAIIAVSWSHTIWFRRVRGTPDGQNHVAMTTTALWVIICVDIFRGGLMWHLNNALWGVQHMMLLLVTGVPRIKNRRFCWLQYVYLFWKCFGWNSLNLWDPCIILEKFWILNILNIIFCLDISKNMNQTTQSIIFLCTLSLLHIFSSLYNSVVYRESYYIVIYCFVNMENIEYKQNAVKGILLKI